MGAAAIAVMGVLMPAFSLEGYLPPEIRFAAIGARLMALVFVSLVLTLLVNLVGTAVMAVSALVGMRR